MFWKNFSNLCVKIGKSPNTVAKELALSSGSITSWKNGAIPRDTTLIKIADYFGVDVSYLTGNLSPLTVTQHNAIDTQPEQSEPLTEQEKTILRLFRETTEEGRMRMIQSILNIHDSINKSTASGGISSLA